MAKTTCDSITSNRQFVLREMMMDHEHHNEIIQRQHSLHSWSPLGDGWWNNNPKKQYSEFWIEFQRGADDGLLNYFHDKYSKEKNKWNSIYPTKCALHSSASELPRKGYIVLYKYVQPLLYSFCHIEVHITNISLYKFLHETATGQTLSWDGGHLQSTYIQVDVYQIIEILCSYYKCREICKAERNIFHHP